MPCSFLLLASFESVLLLPNAFIELPNVLKAAERLFILEDKTLSTNNVSTTDIELLSKHWALSLNNVSYHYGQKQALNNVSFELPAKQKVAIVGRSGSGKTTLVNLLSSLWPLQQGTINLQSDKEIISLHDLNNESRAKTLNILAQQHHIFDGTLSENLAYAAPDATSQQMIAALTQAELGGWFSELKQGLKTRLGTGGRNVSQGQSRRIALAQALLQKPAILVLDEPTEGLDNISKQAVMNSVLQLKEHASVLTITHDPALLSQMDSVIWLDSGQIIAQGSHQQLLNEHPDYVALTTRF